MLIQSSQLKRTASCLVVAMLFITCEMQASELSESQAVISETNQQAANTQQNIDRIANESKALIEEYRRLQNGVEYQLAYTRELEQLNTSQQLRINSLKGQIEEAAITQQRIVPLMRSMADSLHTFIELDLPFHREARLQAVKLLQQRIRQPDLSLSMKFRLLLETWQLEQNYGMGIEAWRGPLLLTEEPISVEFLRIGRVALYYQSLDGKNSGYWDQPTQNWLHLDSDFNPTIKRAIRVAKKQMAPQLLNLPLTATEAQQ